MPTNISPLNILEHSQGIWRRFIDRARQTQFLLMGEKHGAIENPRILITLLSKLYTQIGLRFLGVEWDAEYQEAIDRYVLYGQRAPKPIIPCSEDGRLSLEHLQFLDWLADFNRHFLYEERIQIICFHVMIPEGGTWNDRDRGMYERFIAKYQTRAQHYHPPALLIAGNVHTRTTPFMMPEEDEEYIPLGSFFLSSASSQKRPLCLNLKYASGAIYNDCVKELGLNELIALFNDKFVDAECLLIEAQAEGDFDFIIRQAHPVIIIRQAHPVTIIA